MGKTSTDPIFQGYVTRYASIVAHVRYAHLAQLQPPPYANLAQGGGGTAYALHRIAIARADPALARHARRWLADALADRRPATSPASSYLLGRAGLHALRARIEPAARDRAIAAYLRACRDRGARPFELMAGGAGQLVGACTILRARDDSRLRRFAAARAGELIEHVRQRARTRWRVADAANLAHGWPGTLYAVVSWHALAALTPPPWLVAALVRLARAWREDAVPRPDMRATWCTGAAGVAQLWCKAYALTGEPALLGAARAAGDAARRHVDPARRHLCCGAGGVAYALLALDAIDPNRGWRARARAIGAAAMSDAAPSRWPSGLLWGHPGLACLALDLDGDGAAELPAL